MKPAVNFLRQVYEGSVNDVANIIVAEAEGDKETIIQYLNRVKEYTEKLIKETEDERDS